MTSDECLISKMINELKTTRSSIKGQNAAIADVLDKSNNILLQIENARSLKPVANNGSASYAYNKETLNVLTRIIDKFMFLLSSSDSPYKNLNFDAVLDEGEQRADYLGCNIRKLLAIWDTTQQMRMLLQREEIIQSNRGDVNDIEEDCF